MAYQLTDWFPGYELTDEDMKRLDRQIYKNARAIDDLQNTENIYLALQRNLSLTSADGNIYLNYIDDNGESHVVSGIPLGVDLSNFIPATDFAVMGSKNVISVGEDYQYEYFVQPSDSTQKPVWKVGDVSVASITSRGVLTGRKCGKTKVTAMLNGVSREYDVTVKRLITLASLNRVTTNGRKIDGYLTDTVNDFRNPAIAFVDGKNWFTTFMDQSNDWNNNLYVLPGEKLTLDVDSPYVFSEVLIFTHPTGTIDTSNPEKYVFTGGTGVEGSKKGAGNHFEYVNFSDEKVYFFFIVDTETNSGAGAGSNLSSLTVTVEKYEY